MQRANPIVPNDLCDVTFSVLGVEFRIISNGPPLDYLGAFLDVFESPLPPSVPNTQSIAVDVRWGAPPRGSKARAVPVHRSGSFRNWNIDAEPDASARPWWVLRGKGLAVRIDVAASRMDVIVDPQHDASLAIEHVFTLCRNIALYLRDGSRGNLLHASAVAFDGRAYLFSGPSMTGKTTLMLAALHWSEVLPFANDRVLLGRQTPPLSEAWPSYITICEGTILNHARLRAANASYHDPAYPFRTTTWSAPLRPRFTKASKRLYPMAWLVQALGKPYARSAPIGGVVLLAAGPSSDKVHLAQLDVGIQADREYVVATLEQESFDKREEGFLPFHGLPLPTGSPDIADLVDRLSCGRAGIWSLTWNPRDVDKLPEVLSALWDGGRSLSIDVDPI
jgi:hypothetical protein